MILAYSNQKIVPEFQVFYSNLRNSWHAGNKARKRGIHPGFETQGRRHQKSKTGVSVAQQKGLMSFKNFKKSVSFEFFCKGLLKLREIWSKSNEKVKRSEKNSTGIKKDFTFARCEFALRLDRVTMKNASLQEF